MEGRRKAKMVRTRTFFQVVGQRKESGKMPRDREKKKKKKTGCGRTGRRCGSKINEAEGFSFMEKSEKIRQQGNSSSGGRQVRDGGRGRQGGEGHESDPTMGSKVEVCEKRENPKKSKECCGGANQRGAD